MARKTQVREKSNCQAYVILDKSGKHVATVQSWLSPSGASWVDVWSIKSGENHLSLTHQGSAGGYGYDKFTAALAGGVIDGWHMANHAQRDSLTKSVLERYAGGKGKLTLENAESELAALGARFANNNTSAFYEPGLRRLECLGYTVITAI